LTAGRLSKGCPDEPAFRIFGGDQEQRDQERLDIPLGAVIDDLAKKLPEGALEFRDVIAAHPVGRVAAVRQYQNPVTLLF